MANTPGAGVPKRDRPNSPTLPASGSNPQGPEAGAPKNIPPGSGPVSGPKPKPSTGHALPGRDYVRLKVVQGLLANPNFDWRAPLDESMLAIIDQKVDFLLAHYPGYVAVDDYKQETE